MIPYIRLAHTKSILIMVALKIIFDNCVEKGVRFREKREKWKWKENEGRAPPHKKAPVFAHKKNKRILELLYLQCYEFLMSRIHKYYISYFTRIFGFEFHNILVCFHNIWGFYLRKVFVCMGLFTAKAGLCLLAWGCTCLLSLLFVAYLAKCYEVILTQNV